MTKTEVISEYISWIPVRDITSLKHLARVQYGSIGEDSKELFDLPDYDYYNFVTRQNMRRLVYYDGGFKRTSDKIRVGGKFYYPLFISKNNYGPTSFVIYNEQRTIYD